MRLNNERLGKIAFRKYSVLMTNGYYSNERAPFHLHAISQGDVFLSKPPLAALVMLDVFVALTLTNAAETKVELFNVLVVLKLV